MKSTIPGTPVLPLLLLALFLLGPASTHGAEPSEAWYLRAIDVPRGMRTTERSRPVVIAIVDDGLRQTHQDLKSFLWTNPGEVPFNQMDDDGNGFVDDVSGWDVADGDADCNPPPARLAEYYHGTHLAGIITIIARAALGDRASEDIRLLPVKALSDYADRPYLRSGFAGIEYAASLGADIILCAWTVGHLSPDQARVLQRAASQGVFIVASAGNFPENREVFPAAHPVVFSVAGLNAAGRKTADSNYGTFVDLSAPGEDIRGAGPQADDAYLTKTGTSQAAAMVAAAAALVKLRHPEFTARDLKVALKSSADSLPSDDPLFLGRLGSGRLNVAAAVEATLLTGETARQTKLRLSQGYLRYATADGRSTTWELSHSGEFNGTQFTLESVKGTPGSSALTFLPRRGDGTFDPTGRTTVRLSEIRGPIFIPGPPPLVMFLPDDQGAGLQWLMNYRLDPVHLPTRYCEGTRELDAEGEFEDGSGPDDYAPQSNCFWLIKAPPGKLTRFEFLEFDTEPRHDFLYFFEGRATNEKILAILSGSGLPPEVTSGSPETLVWFVTDSQNQGQGWRVRFKFVDAEASPPPTEDPPP